MKLVSYNVNGIRAAMTKGLLAWIEMENPEVICIQETKAQPEQIDDAHFKMMGYECFWHSAQKKGYSGVGILTKRTPDYVEIGIGDEIFDSEGRLIRMDFGDVSLICSYFPSGSSGDLRQAFKMEYLEAFYAYIERLRITRPKLIITGDFNICHKPIDIHHPERQTNVSGFLPEERAWFDRVEESGFVDTFRMFHTEPNAYSWWSYRAGSRGKNLGWRIDYFWVTQNISSYMEDANIHPDAMHSDHCPVSIEFNLN